MIETGAIFEKYFDCHSVEEAEQIALQFGAMVKKTKNHSRQLCIA
ncbi:hypothetical protein ACT7C6_33040 [Bacillus paranthracis]